MICLLISISIMLLITAASNNAVSFIEILNDDKKVYLEKSCKHLVYKQDVPQPGMHIICAVPDNDDSLDLSIIVDGHDERYFHYSRDTGPISIFYDALYNAIGSSNSRLPWKWGIYNRAGEVLYSIDSLAYEETTFIFTNGHWIWPGAHVGFEQYTENFKLTTLALQPLVFRVSDFLTSDECDYIRVASEPHLAASGTSKMDQDVDKPDTTWRTSTTYFLPSHGHSIVQSIDERVAKLTRTSVHQQEYVQVLRYLEGQKYDHHHDYFDPQFYRKDRATLQMLKGGEVNRLITVLWYLSNVTEGGHTIFPISFDSTPINSKDCSSQTALKVPPVKGNVVVFYSLHADGSLDPYSLHGACPVGQGQTKWAANKWIWTDDKGFL